MFVRRPCDTQILPRKLLFLEIFFILGEMRNILLLFHCVFMTIPHCVLLSTIWYYSGKKWLICKHSAIFPFYNSVSLGTVSAVLCTYNMNLFSVNKVRVVSNPCNNNFPWLCCFNIHKWFLYMITHQRNKNRNWRQVINLISRCYHSAVFRIWHYWFYNAKLTQFVELFFSHHSYKCGYCLWDIDEFNWTEKTR